MNAAIVRAKGPKIKLAIQLFGEKSDFGLDMKRGSDLLYTLFEKHLFNALVEEETSDEFIDRVVRDYVVILSTRGVITREHKAAIETDLRDEVLEMLRKKIYGHYNLAEFRRARSGSSGTGLSKGETQDSKARRQRRAC